MPLPTTAILWSTIRRAESLFRLATSLPFLRRARFLWLAIFAAPVWPAEGRAHLLFLLQTATSLANSTSASTSEASPMPHGRIPTECAAPETLAPATGCSMLWPRNSAWTSTPTANRPPKAAQQTTLDFVGSITTINPSQKAWVANGWNAYSCLNLRPFDRLRLKMPWLRPPSTLHGPWPEAFAALERLLDGFS